MSHGTGVRGWEGREGRRYRGRGRVSVPVTEPHRATSGRGEGGGVRADIRVHAHVRRVS